MIEGTILISTTWAASTSYIPFEKGSILAQNFDYNNNTGHGIYATTALISGVWEHQIEEEKFVEYLSNTDDLNDYQGYSGAVIGVGDNAAAGVAGLHPYEAPAEGLGSAKGLGCIQQGGNAFYPGTVLEVEVRKLKVLRNNQRSGIQVNRRLYKGNKLVFRYLSAGELVRPL